MPRHRITAILAAYFFFAPVAMAANFYVNNTYVYQGTAVSGGTTTTIVMNAAFTASGIAGGALTTNDPRLLYMGLFVTGGTGASQTHHKISAYNASTHTITFSNALSGSSDATTAFNITTGCDLNTGGSETPGSGTTGPNLTIQVPYEACWIDDTIWVKYSGRDYTELEKSNASQQYLRLWRNVAGITIQGYHTTIGDLNTNPSTTYTATSNAAYSRVKGRSAQTAAGLTVYGLGAFMPTVAPQDNLLNCPVYIDGAATVTLRNLIFKSSLTRVIGINSTATSAVVTFDQCIIGAGDVNSQIGIYDLNNSGTHTLTVSKSFLWTRASNIYSRLPMYLNVTDCHMLLNPQGTAVNNIDIPLKGASPTLAYDSTNDAWYASNQTRKIVIDSNWMDHTAEQASCCAINLYDIDGSASVGPNWVEHIRITRNRMRTTRASPVLLMGAPSAEIGYNEIYTDSSSGGSTLINLPPDAGPTTSPGSTLRKVIRRSQCQAGAGSGSIIIDASANATDNAYRYRKITVYKADGTAVQTRPISGYTGASKTVAYAVDGSNATMSPTPANGDLYEIFEERPATILIHDNFCKHMQDVSGNTHGILIGQGWDGAKVWSNTLINSDNGIVAKGEFPVIVDNTVYAGRGTMLPKGGGMGFCMSNTFVCARAQGGGGCLDLQDKSSVAVSASTTALFRGEWSKPAGWVFLNNIFAVYGQDTYCVFDNTADVGTLLAPASLDAAAQLNYFDFNLYAMDGDGDGVYDGGASFPISYLDGAEVNTLALQKTKWTDATYQTAFPYNDLNSASRYIPFVSPSTGNFTPQIRVIGMGGQAIGATVPAVRANRIPLLNAN